MRIAFKISHALNNVLQINIDYKLRKEAGMMKKGDITFSVRMTPIELFKFTMYHNYHKISGVIGICLSLIALVVLITSFEELTDRDKTILTIVALWFIILEPLTLLQRARTQVKRNKTYQKPLTYTMNQEGIMISQDDQQQMIAWENLMKIVETKSQYLVYSSRIHAFIFPKKAIGEECEIAEELMIQYTQDTKVSFAGKIKRHSIK